MKRLLAWRPTVSSEALMLAVSAFVAVSANLAFWRGVLAHRAPGSAATWAMATATLAMLLAIHFVLPALVATRRTVRPILALLVVLAGSASFHAQRYGVVVDPSMVRNVIATDTREAGELLGPALAIHLLLLGVLPAIAIFRVRIRARGWRRGLAVRLGSIGLAALIGVGALMAVFQDFGPLMRNQKSLRYAITPANVVWSLASVAGDRATATVTAREAPDPAVRIARDGRRPTLVVLVIGETVRAANWQLNGYARATTPRLAARDDLVSFARTTACGTATEVSLPCMFSPYGRADYDEHRIHGTDSLLHVAARAGVQVLWRDNQAGCKGVCAGLPVQDLSRSNAAGLCAEDRCLDEILLAGLDDEVRAARGDLLVVMHQLGNHGPAYFRRYPPEHKRFVPACERRELRECGRDEIVNAYDNAISYTDHFLADTIEFLDRQRDRFDVAMLYVSDHGESLGERGLYLHGMPYAIAPREQLEVPMLWWMPDATARGLRIDLGCLRARAARPTSHDALYHSVVGLLEIDTPRYKAARDVFAECRRGA